VPFESAPKLQVSFAVIFQVRFGFELQSHCSTFFETQWKLISGRMALLRCWIIHQRLMDCTMFDSTSYQLNAKWQFDKFSDLFYKIDVGHHIHHFHNSCLRFRYLIDILGYDYLWWSMLIVSIYMENQIACSELQMIQFSKHFVAVLR